MSAHRRHDPGGKVRLRLAGDVTGEAVFSPCGRYRPLLTREYPDGAGTALWIGMNPSTAEADVDDPTVRRESDYSRAWGFRRFVKTNVMDWRATRPADLLAEGVAPRSPVNLDVIREQAAQADLIMLAFGALHPRLRHYGRETVEALRADGRALFCLGLTRDGAPRHPLYMRKDLRPIPFPG
ncbi:DUF1643 domain-containing protein [Oceanicella actignis]|uniref:DUF1643 domain-containing protein n=1 Tax=Oceanicella actignis TaxID=1189325 RepID=A0A1M7SX94_9RHOB|nr:DUF1643 domain-containing protein [Oceanicella actignis]TYO90552.1 hypothetical protein LY05_00683 [Oceanicella actignis]SES75290.1 hypothetical protein SAMN04488119_101361 [Oceanicella actignis]SHN63092.1 hypothetical protein SAMN05216200_103363 [Oceanicella actignis]